MFHPIRRSSDEKADALDVSADDLCFAEWRCKTQLHINPSKTKEMVVDFRLAKAPPPPITILGVDVEVVESHKYLGGSSPQQAGVEHQHQCSPQEDTEPTPLPEEAQVLCCVQDVYEDVLPVCGSRCYPLCKSRNISLCAPYYPLLMDLPIKMY